MAQQAQIDILINAAQSAKTLGQLEKSLSDINEELKNIEVGSDSFNQLKSQADQTQKTLNEINISGFEKKAKGFEATTKTISSSLALATGSMALFGSESEEAAKILTKVQGALAISTAFKDFAEAQKAADESGKGLNKTLLGNPFILIAAALLPLLLKMDSFKEILDVVGQAFGEVMKAVKPLIDALLNLLVAVIKPLMPIIKILADLLVKALAPVMKVIQTVVSALNPLFQKLGEFLTENEAITKALTAALELALLPLTLLIEGLELLSGKDPNQAAIESFNQLAESTETTAEEFDKLNQEYDDLVKRGDDRVQQIDNEIEIAEAQGRSEAEIFRLKEIRFRKEQDNINERIERLERLRRENKLTAEQDKQFNEQLIALNNQLADSQQKQRVSEEQDKTRRREAFRQILEEQRKFRESLEKTGLSLRDIQRQNEELFITPEQEKFKAFFDELRKSVGDAFSKITEEQKKAFPGFEQLGDLIQETFNQPDSFNRFTKDQKDTYSAIFKVYNDFDKFLKGEFQPSLNTQSEGIQILGTQLQLAFATSFQRIIGDANVFDRALQLSFTDSQDGIKDVVDFFNEQLDRLASGADFSAEQADKSFEKLRKAFTGSIERLRDFIENNRDKLTITSQKSLEDQAKLLEEYINNYKKTIDAFIVEDIVALIERPIRNTFTTIFDELSSGTVEIERNALRAFEAFDAIENNTDGIVSKIRANLIKLGFDAEKLDKSVEKLLFRLNIDYLRAVEQAAIRTSERISITEREREKARQEAAAVREQILRREITRTRELAEQELQKYIEEQKKLRAEQQITQEEFNKNITQKTAELRVSTARIVGQILLDIEDNAQQETNRRYERFARTFQEITDAVAQAGQSATDILNNLTQQQLINLEFAFQSTVDKLEAAKNQGLLTQREFDFERLKAQEKYERRRREIEKQAWERNFASSLSQAAIATALAVTNALATPPAPNLIAAALAGALGGAQIAVIATQPKPKFARGGLVAGAGPGDSDTINARISPGEFVVNQRATRRFLPILSQINQFDKATIGRRETGASPTLTGVGGAEPVRAYVVLDELNEKNELLSRIQNQNSFFETN